MSTFDENISSPRGLAAGGIVGIGREVEADRARASGEVERELDLDAFGDSSAGRGKKNAMGFQ